MKTVNFRRILFFAFLTLVFTGGLFFSKGSTWAAECPIHTIGLSYDRYTPDNIEEVEELQKILSEDEEVWDDKYEINGIFNGATVIALYKFQVKYELPAKENDELAGVIDVETRDKLCEFWDIIKKAELQAEKEDPVSGTLSVSASSVNLGQAVTLTLTAQDDQGVGKVFAYYQGSWHNQICTGATTCTKTFSIKETKAGTYSYYGYVVGKKLNGTTEDNWTNPKAQQVKVVSSVPSGAAGTAGIAGTGNGGGTGTSYGTGQISRDTQKFLGDFVSLNHPRLNLDLGTLAVYTKDAYLKEGKLICAGKQVGYEFNVQYFPGLFLHDVLYNIEKENVSTEAKCQLILTSATGQISTVEFDFDDLNGKEKRVRL